MAAGALFNGTTVSTKNGELRTSISLSNEGDQTLYDVEISGDITPSTGFSIVDPGVQEYGGSVKCSTVVDTTTVSPRFSALCAYLNPGDSWQIEVWHLGIMHGIPYEREARD